MFVSYLSFSQVGINTATPHASAVLEIKSSKQGFLPPRVTLEQRNLIVNPAVGLFIFNLDSNCLQYYKGTKWSSCLSEERVNSLSCGAITKNGLYKAGQALTVSNTITIDVLVNAIGNYSVSTNTVNGYSFAASGTFTTRGLKTITLTGLGTPTVSQTDNFIITYIGNSVTCSTTINVTP